MQHFNEQLHDETFGEQKSEQDTVECDYKTTCGGGKCHKQMTDRAGTIHYIYKHKKYSFWACHLYKKYSLSHANI